MGLSPNVEKMVQYRKKRDESESSVGHVQNYPKNSYEGLSDNVRKMVDKRAAQVSKNAKKNSVSLQRDKRKYKAFGSEEVSKSRNNIKISEQARQDALERLRIEQARRNAQLPEQMKLNQERAAMTDFRRQDREDAAQYIKERAYQDALQKAIRDGDIKDPEEKTDQRVADYAKSMIGVVERGPFKESLERIIPYEDLQKQPDFQRMKAEGMKEELNPVAAQESLRGIGLGHYILGALKDPEQFKEVLKQNDHNFNGMTEEEKDTYNYIYGKYGVEQANRYMESLDSDLNIRQAEFLNDRTQTLKEKNKAAGMAANTFLSYASGVNRAAEGLTDDMLDAITGNPVPDAVSTEEAFSSLLSENTKGAERAVYDAANSIGFMTPSTLAAGKLGTKASSAMFGLSAAGNAYADSIREGKSVEDARAYAVATGLSEEVSNMLLGGIGAYGGGALKKILGNTKAAAAAKAGFEKLVQNPTAKRYLAGAFDYLTDMGSEGLQEYTQEFMDKAARNIIFSENNEFRLDDEDAWYSAMLGAMTAGILNAPNVGLNAAYESQIRGLGRESNVTDYQEFVDGIETDRAAFKSDQEYESAQALRNLAQEMVERQESGKKIGNYDRGIFENALNGMAYDILEGGIQEAAEGQNSIQEDISAPDTETPQEIVPGEPQTDIKDNVKEQIEETETQPVQEEYFLDKMDPEGLKLWSNVYGKNGQQAFEQNYDGSGDINGYYRGFAQYYNAGRYNMDISQAEKSAASIFISPEQAKEAYKAGALDRNMEIGYDPETWKMRNMVQGEQKTGGLGFAAESATPAQKKVVDTLGKRTGLRFELVDDVESSAAVASYSPGVVRISTDAKNFNAAVSHELTHFIQDYSPDMYQIYQDSVVKAITEAEGVDFEDMIGNTISSYEAAGQELTRAQAIDEIVADATERYLNDPDFIDRIVKEDRTLGERILDFIEDMIESLKELMKTGKSSRKAAQALEQNLERWEQSGTYWRQGLLEAGDRYKGGWKKTEGTTGKFQLEKPDQVSEEHIKSNYESVRTMEPVTVLKGNEFPKNADTDLITQVTDYYKSIGGKVHNDVVGDIYLNRKSVKDDMAHGIGRRKAISFAAVPDVLEKGKVLDYRKNWKGRKYDTAVIGAPVRIEQGDHAGNYYELAVVTVADDNKMYLHEVYATKMEDITPIKTPSFPQNGSRSDAYALPSIYSIFQKIGEVNGENSGKQENVRFQLKDNVDSDGNALSAQQQEYFKDSKVKDKDGRLLVMYHGTPNAGFTQFRSGTYFTEHKEYADVYQNPSASSLQVKRSVDNPDTYKVYLNIKKPFDTRIPSVKKIWNEEYYRQWGTGTPLMESGLPDWMDGMDLVEFIEENELDFDGIILDEGGVGGYGDEVKSRGLSYVVMSPEQVKNVENTEPTDNPDIRFQLEDVENYQSQIVELLNENDDLREANTLLKKQFELTSKEELRQEDIKKVSGQFLRKYNSGLKNQTLERNLTNLYEYIRSSDRVDPKEVSAVAADIARSILRNASQKDTTLTEQYKDLRRQIKNTKITISEQDRKDLASIGGYNDFRKKYFGRMNLGNDGISVDTLYEELGEQYPELFDIDITHPADRLMQIGNVLDLTQAQVMNPYHANMDEMSYIVGQELINSYWDVRQPAPTYADKKEAELNRVRRQYQEKIRKFKDTTIRQYEAIIAERDREVKFAKDSHAKELLVQQEKFDKTLRKRRESLRKQNAKKRIIKDVTTMQKWLLNPTDAKHVPQETRTMVADFLNSIDFSSKDDTIVTKRDLAWNEASQAFKKILDNGGIITDEEGNVHYVDLDPDLSHRFEELCREVKGIPKIEVLDAYSMEELQKIVSAMRTSLTEMNDMKRNARYRKASLLAEDVFRETQEMGNKVEYTGLLGKGEKLINCNMLDPQTMFGKVGPAFKSTYDSLRDGLNVKTRCLKQAEDYFSKALEDSGISRKDIRKWTGTNAPTHTFQLTAGTIELSIPQIMSTYELDKRGQARIHIYDKQGGIKAAARKMGISLDNKSVHVPKMKKSYRPLRVTKADVEKITAVLTPEQKKLADALQKFMGDEVSKWGNEVSMEMYGYEKFTSKNYFPIVTDKNYVMQKEGQDTANTAIRNLGITKNTNKYANNPVIIEDIFEVFTRQVDQMSSYRAYVLPLSDLHKVMNYKDARGFNGASIKEELERTLGKDGINYIDKLVKDINGSIRPDTSISNLFLSNMKAASVAGNLRVAIQQPTAIARAAAEINPKYLIAGVAIPGKRGQWDTITKYAPIAQWKDWGFYRMQTSRQMKDVLVGSDSAKQRMVNNTMVLAELGDKIAWKRLWNACELETADLHPELEKSSEEFFQTVGKRFSEIVDKTQVADSVLHRTQIMREDDGLTKMATSFMGEPLKSYNMLYRAAYDVKHKKKGAKKQLAASVSAYAASGFLTAISASFIDGLRDDDRDKSYKQKYWESFVSNMKDNINLLNSIPYVKDAMSIAGGYTPARTDLSGIQDIYYAYKKIEGMKTGKTKYTPQYIFLNTVQAMSKATGIPVKSITRDAMAIIDTAFQAAGGEADYTWLKQTYDIGKSDNGKMYAEMILQAEEQGNTKLSSKIREDLMKAGMTEEDIEKKVNNIVNDKIKEEVDITGAIQEYDSSDPAKKQTFSTAVDRYIALKAKAGWDEKKSIEQVRKMITEEYKPQYQAATTQKERDQIISKCKSYYYEGNSIFKDYKFSAWKKKE